MELGGTRVLMRLPVEVCIVCQQNTADKSYKELLTRIEGSDRLVRACWNCLRQFAAIPLSNFQSTNMQLSNSPSST